MRSIVGRFLEHSRIYSFENGGEPQAFIGSADLMERNLDRRVEVLCPVLDRSLLEYLRETVLGAYLRDTDRATVLGAGWGLHGGRGARRDGPLQRAGLPPRRATRPTMREGPG